MTDLRLKPCDSCGKPADRHAACPVCDFDLCDDCQKLGNCPECGADEGERVQARTREALS